MQRLLDGIDRQIYDSILASPNWTGGPALLNTLIVPHILNPTAVLPLREAIDIVLKILRSSGKTTAEVAYQGVYQQMMAGRVAQMIHIQLEHECVPEISANKYALNIRFTTQEGAQRPKAAETDVEFELTFCNL